MSTTGANMKTKEWKEPYAVADAMEYANEVRACEKKCELEKTGENVRVGNA